MLLLTAMLSARALSGEINRSLDEPFSLPTSDGLARIDGVLSLPTNPRQGKLVPVIVVGGTGTSRDGPAYVSHEEHFYRDKFWYRALANAMVDLGFAVVRYDNRGLSSGLECDRILGRQATPDEYIASNGRCYNPSFMATTTFDTKRQDIIALFEMVKNDERLDARRSIVVAHSEGGLHVATLIGKNKIHPAGVVFVGAPVESAAAIAQWQHVDREVDWMADLIKRSGGFVSNVEAAKYYATDGRDYDRPFISLEGGWGKRKLPELQTQLKELFDTQVSESLSVPPDTPMTGTIDNLLNGVVLGPAKYFQSMMSDKIKPIDALANYSGKMVFIYGGRDIKLSPGRQINLIKASPKVASRSRIVLLKLLDHNLALPDGRLGSTGIHAVVEAVEQDSGR